MRVALLIVVGLATVVPARAQTANPHNDPYTDLSRYLLPQTEPLIARSSPVAIGSSPADRAGSVGVTVQVGSANIATLNQTGAGNLASVVQLGTDNTATLTEQGSGNLLVANQVGDNDSAGLTVIGHANQLSATQFGSNLSVGLQQVGTSKGATVVQIGRH